MRRALSDLLLPIPRDYTINDLIRFWVKIDRSGGPDACWPWQGTVTRNSDGSGGWTPYRGLFSIHGKNYFAARVSYFFEYRVDPGRLFVCHECNNPICVNPTHLFLGTQSDSIKHAAECDRRARGSLHSQSCLREEDIPVIRGRLAAGDSYSSIARDFDVSKSSIRAINLGRTRTHVSWQQKTSQTG
jgi:hypothetical protein